MAPNQNEELSDIELDVLWTIYEGHSLVIERPADERHEVSAHVILSVAYDDVDEALAEVADVPIGTAEALIARGYLENSEDGPVLDEHHWYDDELGTYIDAEEYLLSPDGQRAIDETSDGFSEMDAGFSNRQTPDAKDDAD